MTVSRGWTWINEDAPDESEEAEAKRDAAIDRISAECDDLARRWSAIQTEIENEGFARRSGYDDDRDDYDPCEDLDPAELAKIESRKKIADELRQHEVESIERMLAERGARIMRPYEHWNEDERWMEYSERDRDDDY